MESINLSVVFLLIFALGLGMLFRRWLVEKFETVTTDLTEDTLKLMDWSEWGFLIAFVLTGNPFILLGCLIGIFAEGQINRIKNEIPVDKVES